MDLYDQTPISTISVPANTYEPYMYAYPLQIRWKEGECVGGSTCTSITTTTMGDPQTSVLGSGSGFGGGTGSASGGLATTSTERVAEGHGLSTGAIAAIAVVGGIVMLVAIGVLVWWMKGKRKREKPQEARQTQEGWQKAELEGIGRRKVGPASREQVVELDSNGREGGSELP